jgi:hypothetical protein
VFASDPCVLLQGGNSVVLSYYIFPLQICLAAVRYYRLVLCYVLHLAWIIISLMMRHVMFSDWAGCIFYITHTFLFLFFDRLVFLCYVSHIQYITRSNAFRYGDNLETVIHLMVARNC